MNVFLIWLSGFLPARLINDGNVAYLERYYVTTLFGTRIYLHRFVGSDPDRGLHDHPWRWAISVILSGYYYELRRNGLAKRRWINVLNGDTFHRVILPRRRDDAMLMTEPQLQPCWTLFMHRAKREKVWGFLKERGQLGTIFTPHPSAEEQWWKSAPTGKQIRNQS